MVLGMGDDEVMISQLRDTPWYSRRDRRSHMRHILCRPQARHR